MVFRIDTDINTGPRTPNTVLISHSLSQLTIVTEPTIRQQLMNQIHSATIQMHIPGQFRLTEAAGLTVDHPNLVTKTQCLIWGKLTNEERCFIDNISPLMFRTTIKLDPNSHLLKRFQHFGYSQTDAERCLGHHWDLMRFFRNFIPLYSDSATCHRLAALFFLTNERLDKIDWDGNDYNININDQWYTLPTISRR